MRSDTNLFLAFALPYSMQLDRRTNYYQVAQEVSGLLFQIVDHKEGSLEQYYFRDGMLSAYYTEGRDLNVTPSLGELIERIYAIGQPYVHVFSAAMAVPQSIRVRGSPPLPPA